MKESKILNKKIKLVTPKRKNQHILNTKEELEKLEKRSSIECWFAKIKRFNRIHVRRDKNINTYMGFFLLGCMCL
jgi:transposase